MKYSELSQEQEDRLALIFNGIDNNLSPFATQNAVAIRKNVYKNDDLFRSEFGIDVDKILHNALYK